MDTDPDPDPPLVLRDVGAMGSSISSTSCILSARCKDDELKESFREPSMDLLDMEDLDVDEDEKDALDRGGSTLTFPSVVCSGYNSLVKLELLVV